jgi:hypothetical protein
MDGGGGGWGGGDISTLTAHAEFTAVMCVGASPGVLHYVHRDILVKGVFCTCNDIGILSSFPLAVWEL